MPGMYRPRQSLRHTSGNKSATLQQHTPRQNEFEPHSFDEKDKLAEEIIHSFWKR